MAETKIKGEITLEVDESRLEVYAVFRPDKDGEEWNLEKVLTMLAREGIIYGFKPSSVEEALNTLSKLKKTGEEKKVLLAKGDAPELPVREEYEWEDIPIPEAFKERSEEILETDEAPEITVTRIEKVKTEKKVVKKPKLPFMAPKEEVVTVVEKKEIPERVYVDPAVVATGWVEEGEKIATVYAPKSGNAGKDVFGKPIMPAMDDEPSLYLGKGVAKEKGELVAKKSGFVRRGKNWIEIVPFARHDWELTLSKDNATCYISFSPGSKDAPIPSFEGILEDVQALEYPTDALKDEGLILDLFRQAISSGNPLEQVSITRDRDAFIGIQVSEDKLRATLTVRKGRGHGSPLILKEVSTAIRNSGLKGIQTEKLKEDIISFYRGKAHDLEDYVLAEVTPAEAVADPEVECQVTFPPKDKMEELITAARDAGEAGLQGITSLDEFPMEKVEEMATVLRHQPVARIIEPEKGKPGHDVFGKTIDLPQKKEAPVKVFDNLKIEQNIVVSRIAGVLDKAVIEDVFYFRVRPHREAEVQVESSPDNMSAYLTIYPAEGTGKTLKVEDVLSLLKEKNITSGIREDEIRSAVDAAGNGETSEQVVIAEGRYPKDGASNKLELLVDLASGKKVSILQSGRADFKNQDIMTIVEKGQVIAKMLPPDEVPEDGWDISGREIKAKEITSIALEIGKNILQEADEDGSTRLIAATSGELFYDRKFIDVNNVHMVEGNVNLKSGNIKFSGSVNIKGTVEGGFQVFSSGDIQIGETVEGSLISADGNIVVGQGIKGGGKAVLRAKENIQTTFVEHARILAVKDINVKSYCLRSMIKCNGKLTLGREKGNLIGGEVKARKGIEVSNLGSPQGAKTMVSFGQDYLVADQIELEEREIQKIKNKLVKFDAYMNELERERDQGKLERVRKEKLKFLKILENRSLRLFNLREKFEEHVPSEIIVHGTAYPGVLIESHGRTYEVMKQVSGVSFFFDQESGHIRDKVLESK